ncbi:MAG: prepilin peptidase [Puniceicoccales bacterium]|jgi:leader peptidase (prepilin peptidase)/N-methyltransferase|nr:prepilin peptidase [Puniceicoccales bacterium]
MAFLEFWHHPVFGFLIFFLGASLGSFFCLCVLRIPKNISIIFPGSHCDCGKSIPFHLNIPIFSWILLKGKARCCGRKLEFQYIFLELLTAVLFVLLWQKSDPWEFLVHGTFLGLLIVASGIDFATMMIPDRCTIGGAILGILGSVFLAHFSTGNYIYFGAIASLRAMLLGSSILLWISVFAELVLNKEAIGFGDVKLMGCIGAFIGTRGAIFSIFGGTCLGMVAIFPLWWICNRRKNKMKFGTPLPFGPFLALGAVSYLLFFKKIIDESFAQVEILLS